MVPHPGLAVATILDLGLKAEAQHELIQSSVGSLGENRRMG